jgi:transposase InsO family protein
VITDNGPCLLANLFRDTCRALGIMPKRTRHYRPQTNGKAILLDEKTSK